MKKLKHLPLLAGGIILAVLFITCAAALELTPPTEVPTFSPVAENHHKDSNQQTFKLATCCFLGVVG